VRALRPSLAGPFDEFLVHDAVIELAADGRCWLICLSRPVPEHAVGENVRTGPREVPASVALVPLDDVRAAKRLDSLRR
jgi:hypothetical protein